MSLDFVLNVVMKNLEMVGDTSSMHTATTPVMCYQNRMNQNLGLEMRIQNLLAETLFRGPFAEDVKALHRSGPPPTTFFSQSSPMLYRFSQSSRSFEERRLNFDSPSRQSTTRISSDAK